MDVPTCSAGGAAEPEAFGNWVSKRVRVSISLFCRNSDVLLGSGFMGTLIGALAGFIGGWLDLGGCPAD